MIDVKHRCPSYDEDYRLGCFAGAEVTSLSADCLLVAEQGARTINPSLSGFRIVVEDKVSLSTLQRILAVVPAIVPSFFVRSNVLGLVLLFVLAWSAAVFGVQLRSFIPQFPYPAWLGEASTQIFLDPFVLHFVAVLLGSWLLFSIARQKGLSKFLSLLVSVGILTYVLLLSHLISDQLLKPALAYPRATTYLPALEPPITRFIHRWAGVGTAVPSGFMLRQVTLCFAVFWIADHPLSPTQNWGPSRRWLMYSFNVLLVILVAFLRLYNNAHEPFDVIFGAGIGISVFWLSVVPLSALFYERPKSLLYELAAFWMVFLIGLSFYSRNVPRWIITSASIISVLGLLSLVPKVNIRRLLVRYAS